jgi:hypothetical protein
VVEVEMSDTSSQPGSSRFKRSISTDSFLREVTDAGLPRHYYGRTNRTPLNLAVSVGGVLGSLCIYGVLQERLMTIPYGGTTEEPESAEMFTSSVFLVLMNRLVTVCVSAMGIVLTGDSFRTMTPLNLYASIAFANLVTTVCQYEVLKYLSFAASTLAKVRQDHPGDDLGTGDFAQELRLAGLRHGGFGHRRVLFVRAGPRRDSEPATAARRRNHA